MTPNSPSPARSRIGVRAARFFGVSALLILTIFAAITYAQARAMTHYQPASAATTRLSQLTTWGRARILLFGPTIRRQSNTKTPADFGWSFDTRHFPGAQGLQLESWQIAGSGAQVPVILMFPGYGASKDTLFGAAREFRALGYALWMVDPHGIGGSEGNATSVGYHEAEDVAAAFRHAQQLASGRKIILYGSSMGAVAILRALHEHWVEPQAIVLECPFDRFTTTIGNRFRLLGLPAFPFAWGVACWVGVQQGFNGLAHNPVDYATAVRCPSLLLQGERDESVGVLSVRAVAQRLKGDSRFELIPGAGHAFLATRAPDAWRRSVREFLGAHAPTSKTATKLERE